MLVSDGIDTCAPPPVCEVAKELHEQGIDLGINTIGFNVDEEAARSLPALQTPQAANLSTPMMQTHWRQ